MLGNKNGVIVVKYMCLLYGVKAVDALNALVAVVANTAALLV